MKSFISFLVAGLAGFVVDGVVFFCLQTYWDVHLSRVVAFVIAVNVTFLINCHLTFSSKPNRRNYIIYLIGQSKGILINILVFELCLLIMAPTGTGMFFSFALGSIVALMFNYLFAKKVVFIKKKV